MAFKSRVADALDRLARDGAGVSSALIALVAGLELEGPSMVVVDMLEHGLDEVA